MDDKDKTKKPRGNPSKLTPQSKRTKREQSEIAKKGGVASGQARTKRRLLREGLIALLEARVGKGDTTYQDKIELALINSAMCGDVKAFVAIRDTIGEKPTDIISVASQDSKLEISFVKPKDTSKQDPKIIGEYTSGVDDNEY